MEIKKRFSDLGSIVKVLLRHIDLNKAHLKIGYSRPNDREIYICVFMNSEPYPLVYYSWVPGKIQTINIPDHICLPHVLEKKVHVQSIFQKRLHI